MEWLESSETWSQGMKATFILVSVPLSQGLSDSAIAKEIGCSVSLVRGFKRKLRKQLGGQHEHDR